jgi:formimidoylglutamate deiminase
VDFLAQGGRMGIGSDSHVSLSVVEELRWLEYGQRLRDQRRNRLYARISRWSGAPCMTRRWMAALRRWGSRSARWKWASVRTGWCWTATIRTCNGQWRRILNRWLFAGGDRQVRDVLVNGQWVVRDGRHAGKRKATVPSPRYCANF